ncbi:MAG TPA: lysophospholipid acyltransferase family protein [Planctomycetota bacterium]|nr:lysophospholipid acyltransferase family protein [Planctomycetota bacterium]
MSSAEFEWPVPWEAVEGDRNGPGQALSTAALRALVAVVGRLPWGLQQSVVGAVARLAKAVDRRHSDAGRRFVETALGPGVTPQRREELVLAAWEHLLTHTLEMARFDEVVTPERFFDHVHVDVSDDVRRMIAQARGGLLLTAHVGAFELAPVMSERLGTRPMYVVSRPPRNGPLSRLAQRQREARGYRLLHRHGAAASIPRVVAGGGYVGLMVDQRARLTTEVAPFFGQPAHCERAVAVFARRLGVPVAFGAVYRTERRWHYRAEYSRVLWPEDLAGRSLEEVTTRINAELERMILAAPEQYFWIHDRFRGAPDPGGAATAVEGS